MVLNGTLQAPSLPKEFSSFLFSKAACCSDMDRVSHGCDSQRHASLCTYYTCMF